VEGTEQLARKNAILNAIPRHDFHRLLPHMQKMDLEAKQVIYQEGEPIDHLLSMLMPTAEGGTVELGMVGREGFVGAIDQVATRLRVT
jgi:CRP-like cAMP-binding protein